MIDQAKGGSRSWSLLLQCSRSNISKIVDIFVYLIPIPQLVAKQTVFSCQLEYNWFLSWSLSSPRIDLPAWLLLTPLMTGCCLVVRSSLCLWMSSMALLKLPSPMETARMALACKMTVSLVSNWRGGNSQTYDVTINTTHILNFGSDRYEFRLVMATFHFSLHFANFAQFYSWTSTVVH